MNVALFRHRTQTVDLAANNGRCLHLTLGLASRVGLIRSRLQRRRASVSNALGLSIPDTFDIRGLSGPLGRFLGLRPTLSISISISSGFISLIRDSVSVTVQTTCLGSSKLGTE